MRLWWRSSIISHARNILTITGILGAKNRLLTATTSSSQKTKRTVFTTPQTLVFKHLCLWGDFFGSYDHSTFFLLSVPSVWQWLRKVLKKKFKSLKSSEWSKRSRNPNNNFGKQDKKYMVLGHLLWGMIIVDHHFCTTTRGQCTVDDRRSCGATFWKVAEDQAKIRACGEQQRKHDFPRLGSLL
jgi:hypothetical protein